MLIEEVSGSLRPSGTEMVYGPRSISNEVCCINAADTRSLISVSFIKCDQSVIRTGDWRRPAKEAVRDFRSEVNDTRLCERCLGDGKA